MCNLRPGSQGLCAVRRLCRCGFFAGGLVVLDVEFEASVDDFGD